MTTKDKLLYLGVIPLAAAGMGAFATFATQETQPQIVLTEAAVKAAKGGPIKVEVDVKSDEKTNLLMPLMPLAMLGGVGLMFWAMNKS